MLAGETDKLLSQPFTLLSAQSTNLPIVIYQNGGVAVGGVSPQVPERARRLKKKST